MENKAIPKGTLSRRNAKSQRSPLLWDLHCYDDRLTHNNKWFLTVILLSEEISFLWLKITLKFEPTCQNLNEEADLSFIEQPSSTRSSIKNASWGALPPRPPASAFLKRIFANLPFSARIGPDSNSACWDEDAHIYRFAQFVLVLSMHRFLRAEYWTSNYEDRVETY